MEGKEDGVVREEIRGRSDLRERNTNITSVGSSIKREGRNNQRIEIHHGEGELGNSQTIRRRSGNSGFSDSSSVDIVNLLVVGHVEASGDSSVREVGVGDVTEELEGLAIVGAIDGPIGGIVGIGHSGGGDTVLVEVLSTVGTISVGNDEIGLGGLLSMPVGGVGEIVDVSNAGASRLSSDSDVEGSTNVVGHHLLESGVEEEGSGVVGKKVDNTNGDNVGASSEDAVGTADESVGGGGLTAGGSSSGRNVSSRKVLSDELDSIDVHDVTGTSLDSQLKAIIAGRAHGDSVSEEPDVLSVGSRRIGGVKSVETSDGSSSIPVGNESGGVGPGGGSGIDLVRDIIREIIDSSFALVDGGNGVVITLIVEHLNVKSGVGSPAIAEAISEVNIDDTSGEAVVHVLGNGIGEYR